MSKIWIIAWNTVRQSIRQRLFLNVVVFGIGMVLLSMVVANITFGESTRVVRSLGLSGVTFAIDLMALLLGISLVYHEIDKKTLFVILVRPLSRWQYLLGRYVGLMLTLILALASFSVVFFLILMTVRGSPTSMDVYSILALIPEAAILGGFGILLSTFSTPMLSAGMGLGFWAAAASTDDLIGLTQKADAATKLVMKVLYYILPNLARLNFRDQAVYQEPVAAADFFLSCGYGTLYAAALVALACVVLTRREMV